MGESGASSALSELWSIGLKTRTSVCAISLMEPRHPLLLLLLLLLLALFDKIAKR